MSDKTINVISKISIYLMLIITIIAIFIMYKGIGTENKDYGPGAYYYTDIPGWQNIFYEKNNKK